MAPGVKIPLNCEGLSACMSYSSIWPQHHSNRPYGLATNHNTLLTFDDTLATDFATIDKEIIASMGIWVTFFMYYYPIRVHYSDFFFFFFFFLKKCIETWYHPKSKCFNNKSLYIQIVFAPLKGCGEGWWGWSVSVCPSVI